MASRRAFAVAVAGVALVVAVAGAGAHSVGRRARAAAPRARALPDPRGWPAATAALTPLAPVALAAPLRVYLDAGHGAPGNGGNTSCFCVAEEDFTLRSATHVARRLEATGSFAVRVSRAEGALVEYRERVAAAAEWNADAFVSLHSDVRGHVERWAPEPGADCPVSSAAPGFAVLFSDEGDEGLVAARRSLASATARRMRQTGLLPYEGATYDGMYQADDEPGAYLDRHADAQRIFVLRKTTMPAILVETHHALDPREATRWDESATLDAFASAVAAALADALGARPGDPDRAGERRAPRASAAP